MIIAERDCQTATEIQIGKLNASSVHCQIPFCVVNLSLTVFLCWAEEYLQPWNIVLMKTTSRLSLAVLISHLCVELMHVMSQAIFICRIPLMNTRRYT